MDHGAEGLRVVTVPLTLLLGFALGLAHGLALVVLAYRQGFRRGELDTQRTIYPDKAREIAHLREIVAQQRAARGETVLTKASDQPSELHDTEHATHCWICKGAGWVDLPLAQTEADYAAQWHRRWPNDPTWSMIGEVNRAHFRVAVENDRARAHAIDDLQGWLRERAAHWRRVAGR